MANAPVAMGGPPPWAIDQHNVLLHTLFWNQEKIEHNFYNTQLALKELSGWSSARTFNASCHHDSETLQALNLPPVPVPLPVIPAPPAPGAVLVLPAPFVAPAIVLPGPPPTFPATKGALCRLSSNALAALLVAYGQPVPATRGARRAEFADFIGVRL